MGQPVGLITTYAWPLGVELRLRPFWVFLNISKALRNKIGGEDGLVESVSWLPCRPCGCRAVDYIDLIPMV